MDADAISDLFGVGLVNTGKYNVLDRANVKQIFRGAAISEYRLY